jgi:hypothetical protein
MMKDTKMQEKVVDVTVCGDIDSQARILCARGYKIMLDSREMFTEQFMQAEDAGLLVVDTLGFTWYPMSNKEMHTRAYMLRALARVWIGE